MPFSSMIDFSRASPIFTPLPIAAFFRTPARHAADYRFHARLPIVVFAVFSLPGHAPPRYALADADTQPLFHFHFLSPLFIAAARRCFSPSAAIIAAAACLAAGRRRDAADDC
jgi:hypothetical protein